MRLNQLALDDPEAAKKEIFETMAATDFVYDRAAKQLDISSPGLRRLVKSLGISQDIQDQRTESGNDFRGACMKPVAPKGKIQKLLKTMSLGEASKELGVSIPTLRNWIRFHGLDTRQPGLPC